MLILEDLGDEIMFLALSSKSYTIKTNYLDDILIYVTALIFTWDI